MMFDPGAKANETPGLEEYLAAIRQRKILIVLCTLLGIAAALFYTTQRQDSWEASAKVLVNPTNVGTIDQRLAAPELEREREVIASNAVARLVAEDLGITTSPLLLLRDLEVVFIDNSDTLELFYVHLDPGTAQDTVNAFASNYVEKRVAEAQDLDGITVSELTATIAEIDEEIAVLEDRANQLSVDRSEAIANGVDSTVFADDLSNVRAELNNLRIERRQFAQDLNAAELARSTRTIPAEVLQFADVPTVPAGLSRDIVAALGLILGVAGGIGLAFVLQRLDRTARESSDVELALGTSVLASIPSFGVGYRTGSASVVMLAGGKSARVQRSREAFRRLRSSMQFLSTSRDAETFLLTSARPSEGKSTTAVNVAVALAQSSVKVCLINADLRRPTVEKLLGLPSGQSGLANWLQDPTITNIMVAVPSVPGLVVVPAGPPPPNPGELLATGRLPTLLDELTGQFDVIIVDAPPVLSAADASTISSSVDGTVIVVDSNRTDTDTLLRVRADIDRAGGTVVGAILNRDDADTGPLLRKDRYAYEKVTASRSNE